MEIVGSVTVSALMAIVAGFITQFVKGAIPEEFHRFIPLPLALVTIGLGVLLAWLQGQDMVAGGIEGFLAAALAAYGYDAIKGFIKPGGGE
jgi:uncharacterized membrane protein YqgA involved in biofilm formation